METSGVLEFYIFKLLIYKLFHCFIVASFSWFLGFFHDTLNSILLKTISLKCSVLCCSQYFRFKSVWRIICFWLFASSQFAPQLHTAQMYSRWGFCQIFWLVELHQHFSHNYPLQNKVHFLFLNKNSCSTFVLLFASRFLCYASRSS